MSWSAATRRPCRPSSPGEPLDGDAIGARRPCTIGLSLARGAGARVVPWLPPIDPGPVRTGSPSRAARPRPGPPGPRALAGAVRRTRPSPLSWCCSAADDDDLVDELVGRLGAVVLTVSADARRRGARAVVLGRRPRGRARRGPDRLAVVGDGAGAAAGRAGRRAGGRRGLATAAARGADLAARRPGRRARRASPAPWPPDPTPNGARDDRRARRAAGRGSRCRRGRCRLHRARRAAPRRAARPLPCGCCARRSGPRTRCRRRCCGPGAPAPATPGAPPSAPGCTGSPPTPAWTRSAGPDGRSAIWSDPAAVETRQPPA